MHHIIFKENTSYEIALLIKYTALKKHELESHYINQISIKKDSIIAFSLKYNEFNKTTAKIIKEYLNILLKSLDSLGITTLYVCDTAYFKTLTKSRKAEPHYGYILDCKIKGYEHIKVILGVNYQSLFYNPTLQTKVDLSLKTLVEYKQGIHITLGSSIIHSEAYPGTISEIKKALSQLHQHDALVVDLETFSLMFNKAGIGTIAFAWDKHNGIAFCCDYTSGSIHYGKKINNPKIKELLLNFFLNYKGKFIYHNANFDIKILIYELFMRKDLLNQQGLINGLQCLTKNIDDTKIITYLATNTTAGNILGLKENAQEFAGNYAEEDIKDICKIPKEKLLRYNLVDCLSTWYVKEKNEPIMIADKQQQIYSDILIPSIKVILQMELSGMPMNMSKINKAETELNTIANKHLNLLNNSKIIQDFTKILRKEEWVKKNLLLKVKIKPIKDFAYITYNPNSPKQTAKLLCDIMKLPALDLTDTGQPGAGAKTIEKLKYHTVNKDYIKILDALIGLSEVTIILNTFIKVFKLKTIHKADGFCYLHGNFNIGGTLSGRLSSSGPNMQNLPNTGTIYGKIIKKCFRPPPGWLLVGADFSSLEDRISALTTKDPNKLRVYIDGFDGHCLRAFSYYGDQMPDIQNTIASINSIKTKYPTYRQKSKNPTFALTYQGTWHTLVNNIGLSKKEAKSIEKQYHELYKVSDTWVKNKLKQATINGYVTVAFGLRVRTPILSQTLLNKHSTPYEASAEARSAGNALGQSYGLLNNRASIEFQERVLNSNYALQIKPISQIHDSMYFLIKNNIGCVKWVNDNLIECMKWQNLPELKHDIVKIESEMDIFNPSWATSFTIPNYVSKKEILKAIGEN